MKLWFLVGLFIHSYAHAQSCDELEVDAKKLQAEIYEKFDTTQDCQGLYPKDKNGEQGLFDQNRCEHLSKIELLIIKKKHELSLVQGLKRLKAEIVDEAQDLTPQIPAADFVEKLKLAAGLEMGMQGAFKAALEIQKTDNINTSAQALSKVCDEKKIEPFCSHFKKHLLPSSDQMTQIDQFLLKWNPDQKLDPYFQVLQKNQPTSLAKVWEEFDKKDFNPLSWQKANRPLYDYVKSLKLDVAKDRPEPFFALIQDIKKGQENLKNSQVHQILKKSMGLIDLRLSAELMQQMSLGALYIKPNYPTSCQELDLAQCKTDLAKTTSTQTQIQNAIDNLVDMIGYEQEQDSIRNKCVETKTELDKCLASFTDEIQLQRDLSALEDLKKQRDQTLAKPRALLQLVLQQHKNNECSGVEIIEQADCDFIKTAETLKPIEALTFATGEAILFDAKQDQAKLLSQHCKEDEKDEFYKRICRQYSYGNQRKKNEIIPEDDDDDDEDLTPKTSTKAPGSSGGNIMDTLSGLMSGLMNRQQQTPQTFYNPYQYSYPNYGGNQLEFSNSILGAYTYFGGYGQYYSVPGGAYYSDGFSNFYGLGAMGSFNRDYNYTSSSGSTTSIPNGLMYNFN
jgi:hypothetical protein